MPRLCRAWVLAALVLAALSPAWTFAFNADTARTMMAFSDAVHEEPKLALDRMQAMGATETTFSDGGTYAAYSPTLFDPGSQVTVSKLLRNGKTIFVVTFRGTQLQDPRDLKTDLNFKSTAMSADLPDVKIHTGFLKTANLGIQALRAFLAQIKNDPNTEVMLTGHSLGGAGAVVAAAQLADLGVPKNKISVYAFGAPAVGNRGFENRYGDLNVWRVNQPNDPVPKLLDNTIMGYRHIGREGILQNGQISFAPPQRTGIIGRFVNGIRTLFGLFGRGRDRNLNLGDHLRPAYTGALAGAGVTGIAQDAQPLVIQPPQAVTPIAGRLPTV